MAPPPPKSSSSDDLAERRFSIPETARQLGPGRLAVIATFSVATAVLGRELPRGVPRLIETALVAGLAGFFVAAGLRSAWREYFGDRGWPARLPVDLVGLFFIAVGPVAAAVAWAHPSRAAWTAVRFLALWGTAAAPTLGTLVFPAAWLFKPVAGPPDWLKRDNEPGRIMRALGSCAGLTLISTFWLRAFWSAEPDMTLESQPIVWLLLAAMASGAGVAAGVAMLIQAKESSSVPAPSLARVATLRDDPEGEREWTRIRRKSHSLDQQIVGGRHRGLVGLSLSGGGIRSATVSLGFLQALATRRAGWKRPVLDFVDYLSTVSGGGWAGGALTTRLAQEATSGSGAEAEPHDRSWWDDLAKRLRMRGDYLVPGGLGFSAGTVRPLLLLVWGALINAASGLCLVMAALLLTYHRPPRRGLHWDALGWCGEALFENRLGFLLVHYPAYMGPAFYGLNLIPLAFVVACGVFVLGLVAMLVSVIGLMPRVRFVASLIAARAFIVASFTGLAVLALQGRQALTFLVAGSLLAVVAVIYARGLSRSQLAALAGTVVASSTAILKVIEGLVKPGAESSEVWAITRAWHGALRAIFHAPPQLVQELAHGRERQAHAIVAGLFGFSFLVFGFLVSRNHTSLRDFWEYQIYRAYLSLGHPREEPAAWPLAALRPVTQFKPASEDRRNKGGPQRGAPLPIITAAVNVPGSGDDKLKKRGTDRFELSPYFVGGPATGWAKTKHYRDTMTLRSAIALSAAAVNSQGGGAIPRWARAILSLFNLGLGSWIRNPRFADGHDLRFRRWGHFWTSYSLADLLGTNDEKRSLVLVSDGGHHDNLGLTALVERECDVVISLDASEDVEFTCAELSRAAMLLRVDNEWDLTIAPDQLAAVRPHKPRGKVKDRSLDTPVAMGTFQSHKSGKVTVFYVKAALTKSAPLEVQHYAEANRAFPHESTADQFFSEAQFEAYRLLGVSLGERTLETLEKSEAWQEVLAVHSGPEEEPASAPLPPQNPPRAERAEHEHAERHEDHGAVGDTPAA